jgi:hypothetical protein
LYGEALVYFHLKDHILELLDKAYRNIKKGQFSAGPTFLFLNLEMLSLFGETPVSLACCSYQPGLVASCVSGELWHVAFGQPEHLILDMPKFEGKPSVVGAPDAQGILERHPELLGLGILVADLDLRHKVYLLHRSVCPSGPSRKPYLAEATYDKVTAKLSDTRNDDLNSAAWKYLVQI